MRVRRRAPLLLCALVPLLAGAAGCADDGNTYYAVEMNGTLVGYTEVDTSAGDPGTGATAVCETDTRARLSLLGRGLDLHIRERVERDPVTGDLTSYDADIVSGEMELGATATIEGRAVEYRPRGGGRDRRITVDEDVLFVDNTTFPYLRHDFADGARDSASYRVFDWATGEIHDVDVRAVGRDSLFAAGRPHECLVFDLHNHGTGVRGTFWIDRDTAVLVRAERTDGVTTVLADAGVRRRLKRLDVAELVFIPAGEDIEDVQDIAFMRVRARIRVPGRAVSAASLNRPGQRFEGTVEDNLVDGVFTVEHRPYDGHGAPSFPRDANDSGALRRYLEPEMTIESDDSVLAAKARGIIAGAPDSWIAATRLARWVGEKIDYEIPGGTARQTYDSRRGECGAHSRLMVAFCRAVGIPARLVMGCMYAHAPEPIFGQHVWVEVHLGQAGWIPLDPTAKEYHVVDSGHIRLGELAGFHPEAMEILDYRVGDRETDPGPGAAAEK